MIFMIEQELKQKLKQFLQENNREYYADSIEYYGLRKSATFDGKIRNFHIVSYMVSVSNQQYDSDKSYFAHFDEKNHSLVEIIRPQSWENFEK
jgi:hypothetical protein